MNKTKVNEIFKPITGYEELYLVSNFGNVKSIRRNKLLKKSKQDNYLAVTLCDNNKRKTIQIHRLVAMMFLNEKSVKGKRVVHHINHNGNDNRVENLQMVSHRKNCSLRKKDNGMPTGVEKSKKRYYAKIILNGNQKRLGSYETPEEAGLVYKKALNKHLKKQ